jgi:hypothetical protein
MRDQIVGKLARILRDRLDGECKVVYILAECRKLMEKYPPDPVPLALKMYCHWALHVDLTQPATTGDFLTKIDDFVHSVLSGSSDIVEEYRIFREFAFLDSFRAQFRAFLKSYDLPTQLCEEDRRWHEFLNYYGKVIEDGTLRCVSKSRRLQFVSQVNISKAEPRPGDAIAPFDLAWEIVLQDGKIIDVDVYGAPMPDGQQMLVHGIQVR